MGSGFNFKVNMNSTNKIIKDHGLNDEGFVTKHLRDTIDRFSDPFIPFDRGPLKNNKRYPNNHSIKYVSPYAKLHYHGKLMLAKNGSSWAKKGEKKVLTNKSMKYHTSGTGPKWDKLMMQRRRTDVVKDLQNFIKRGGK